MALDDPAIEDDGGPTGQIPSRDVADNPRGPDLHLYEDVRGDAAPIRLQRRACDVAEVWRETWAHLEPAIAIALRCVEQFQTLRQEAAGLKQALEDRKAIEKVKGILMKQAGLDEHDAFRRLQKLASEKNQKLVAIAQMILTAEEAYGGSSRAGRGAGPGSRPVRQDSSLAAPGRTIRLEIDLTPTRRARGARPAPSGSGRGRRGEANGPRRRPARSRERGPGRA